MMLFKFLAIILGLFMSLVNISLGYDTFNFFDSNLTYNVSEARVAGFALVAAMLPVYQWIVQPKGNRRRTVP